MPNNDAPSLNRRAIQLVDALETDAAYALFRQNYRAHPSLMTSVFQRICAHNSSASTFAAAGSDQAYLDAGHPTCTFLTIDGEEQEGFAGWME